MTSTSDALRKTFDTLLAELLRETGASRSTLRLDDAAYGFHSDDVVAEALAPGEESMRGAGGINHRAAETAQWLETHRTLLVQDHFDSGPAAPEKLRQYYRVKAQMLAPVIREGRLDGWVSIHEAKAPRKWSEADKAAIRAAAQAVVDELGRAAAKG
jgi:GAF domain-containing protein